MENSEVREAITLSNKGEKIFAIFHRPKTEKKFPAIIICPGFGGNKCGKHRLFVRLAEKLAKSGIAVLRFDYRGAGDSEGEFTAITLRSKVSDALICLDFLKKHPSVDVNRIGLLGRSLGGVIALLVASEANTVKSLALWAPVFSSQKWKEAWEVYKLNSENPISTEILEKLPGGIPNEKFLSQFFSLNILEVLKKLNKLPLLHLHGALDKTVNIDHAEEYKKARSDSSGLSDFIRLEKSDHDFSDFSDQKIAIESTLSWFKNTLK